MGSYPTPNLMDVLSQYVAESDSVMYIICPFITPSIFGALGADQDKQLVIVTSWRGDHLRTGVSSLALYEVCCKNEWTLYINDQLHAKIYSDSLRSAWIGSANLTESALLGHKDGNIEWLTFQETLTASERVWIMRLVGESRLVTDDLYARYRQWLSTQEHIERVPRETAVTTSEQTTPDPFLTSQLPASESPLAVWDALTNGFQGESDENLTALHDVALYQLDHTGASSQEQFLTQLGERFFAHPFIRALEAVIPQEGMYFGTMKAWVQETCTDVPVPFRRELTPRIQSLYQWFTVLAPSRYEIVRPRHSECLRRIDVN
jgi:hypothetical protein